jgi:hypothetical protein
MAILTSHWVSEGIRHPEFVRSTNVQDEAHGEQGIETGRRVSECDSRLRREDGEKTGIGSSSQLRKRTARSVGVLESGSWPEAPASDTCIDTCDTCPSMLLNAASFVVLTHSATLR